MKAKASKMQFFPSVEDASVIRKFGVLFFAGAILPLLLLVYIYCNNFDKEVITISAYDLRFSIFFATLGIVASFIGMRSALRKIQVIHSSGKKGEEGEQNEITALSQSFASIQKQVEESMRRLDELSKAR